jgi:hypothetical protein
MIRALAVACLMSLAAGAVATSADAGRHLREGHLHGRRHRRIYRERHTLFRRRLHPGPDDGDHRKGGQFGGFPSGTIFGAIVSLASATAFPDFTPSTIEASSLADVVFAAPSDTTDLTENLNITPSAGSYGVVFGSGAFGAEGWGGPGGNNDPVGSPNFFTYFQPDGDSWEGASLDGARITISGGPEASTWAMMLIGFGGLGFAGARA